MALKEELKGFSCWCPATERQVQVKGEVREIKPSEVIKRLSIKACTVQDCPLKQSLQCLIGKVLEGTW